MKNLKYSIGILLSMALIFSSCQDDDFTVGDLITPSNIQLVSTYIDDGVESTAPGLGSGVVEFTASATDAISYHLVIQGATVLQADGVLSHSFTLLGPNTYTVTVSACGT